MHSIQKTAIRVGALVACAVVLTACNDDTTPAPADTSTPSSSASSSASAPATTGAATAAPTSAAAGAVPGGTKLKTLLPTAATVPSGWKLDNSDAFDSGGTAQEPSDPEMATEDCNDVLTGANPQDLTSDYRAAYATTAMTDPDEGSSNVVFDSYQPGDAAKQMTEIKDIAKRCGSYTGKAGSGKNITMTVTLKAVPGLGDDAFELKVKPTGPYVGNDNILVRSGDLIMAVDEDEATGKSFPLAPVAKQLAAPLTS